jgi:GT2 family glycosyltransferase
VELSKQEIVTNKPAHAPRPPLSVVVATTQPWPKLQGCMTSLYSQAKDAGAEIIVADSHGQGLPDDSVTFPGVIWLKSLGASIYQLRALAMAQARGEIVALAEDHCQLGPDWCAGVLRAHQEYPDVAVVGGAIENGATNSLIDWASFFYVNGHAMQPLGTRRTRQISQVNVAYKRRVVPATVPQLGRMEFMLNETLGAQGEKLLVDDRITVNHIQSLGFLDTCKIRYHSSRSVGGFRLEQIGPLERGIRLAACFVMPPILFFRAVFPLIGKPRLRGKLIMSLPLMALLVCIRSVGAFTGLVTGPRNSPQQIR